MRRSLARRRFTAIGGRCPAAFAPFAAGSAAAAAAATGGLFPAIGSGCIGTRPGRGLAGGATAVARRQGLVIDIAGSRGCLPPGFCGSLVGRTVSPAGSTTATATSSPSRPLTILALGVRPPGGRGRVELIGVGRHGLDKIGGDLIPPRFALGNVFRGPGQPGNSAAGSLLVSAAVGLPASGGPIIAIPRRCFRPVALPSSATTTASAPSPPPPAVSTFISVFTAAALGAFLAAGVRGPVFEPADLGPLARLGGYAVVECRSTLTRRASRLAAIRFADRRAAILSDGFSRSSGRLLD